ncbi:hypothetical protein P7C64_10s3g16960 [Encephalitozoon intestinalis]
MKNEISDGDSAAIENTSRQIPHSEFEAFLKDYFAEADEKKFNQTVLRTPLDEEWLEEIVGKETECAREAMIKGLMGCLIDEGDILNGFSEVLEEEGSAEMEVEDCIEVEKTLRSFSLENIRDLVRLYKEQVSINNKRKDLLRKKLKERLAYYGYWMVLRAIDSEIEDLVSREKGRKKGIEEERAREVLEKRSEFMELFKDFSVLEEDYRNYEDLFDPKENVDASRHGVFPYDYFS